MIRQEDFAKAVGWALWFMAVWPEAKVQMFHWDKYWYVNCDHSSVFGFPQ